jgi:hypothetical protein
MHFHSLPSKFPDSLHRHYFNFVNPWLPFLYIGVNNLLLCWENMIALPQQISDDMWCGNGTPIFRESNHVA